MLIYVDITNINPNNKKWIQTLSEKVRLTLQIIVNYTPVTLPTRYGWIHRDRIYNNRCSMVIMAFWGFYVGTYYNTMVRIWV